MRRGRNRTILRVLEDKYDWWAVGADERDPSPAGVALALADRITDDVRVRAAAYMRFREIIESDAAPGEAAARIDMCLRNLRGEPLVGGAVGLVVAAASEIYGIPPAVIQGRRSDRAVSTARSAAMYVLRVVFGMSFEAIGQAFTRTGAGASVAISRAERCPPAPLLEAVMLLKGEADA